MSDPTEVRVPDIGDFSDVPVIEIHVAPGDEVAAEDPLVTLESDKATMDVPSPSAGVVAQLRVQIGDRVVGGQRAADARGWRMATGGEDVRWRIRGESDGDSPSDSRPAPARR